MRGAGPTGSAAEPPAWLSEASLPLTELPADSMLVRIHATGRNPIFFSPGEGRPATGRFDSAAGRFGVLYLAGTFQGAFAETLLRNPARQMIGLSEIRARSVTLLGVSRAIRLVSLHGPGLQALGVDNAITTGPYGPCGLWADALFGHKEKPDGIAYCSRHDPEELCVALFSGRDVVVSLASESVGLTEMLVDVAAVLRRYRKGLEG